MSWVRLDDGFAEHPRTVRAGPVAAWHLVNLLCWSARYLTDGHVPVGIAQRPDPADAQRLVEVGFLHRCTEHDGCLVITAYLRWQPSAEDARALREKRAKAGRRGGMRSGQSRREATDEASASADAEQTPSKSDSIGSSNGEAESNPVPVPVPVPVPPPVLRKPPVVEDVGYAREDGNGGGGEEGQEPKGPQDPEGWAVVLAAVRELGRSDRGAGGRAQADVDDEGRFSVPGRMMLARQLANRLAFGWLAEELVAELVEGRWGEVAHPLRVWQRVAASLPASRRPLADVDR